MKKRIITAVALLALFIVMFVTRIWTPFVFDIGCGILIIVASMEMSKLLSKMGIYNYYILAGCFPSLLYLTIGLMVYFQINLGYIILACLGVIIAAVILTLIISLCFPKQLRREMGVRGFKRSLFAFAARKACFSSICFVYPAFLLVFLLLSNRFSSLSYCIPNIDLFSNVDLGLLILLLSFLIPIISDTMAMFTGMAFKGPKLAEKLSPKKTISGFVGGVVWTTLILSALFFIFDAFDAYSIAFQSANIKVFHFAILGFVGSLVAAGGDLLESFIKRRANVKDAGNILPGHGGVLDRFDSHILTAPFVFLFFVLLLV